jgi:hypothetical protein
MLFGFLHTPRQDWRSIEHSVPIVRIAVSDAASLVHHHTPVRSEWLRVLSWQRQRPFGAGAADRSLPHSERAKQQDYRICYSYILYCPDT